MIILLLVVALSATYLAFQIGKVVGIENETERVRLKLIDKKLGSYVIADPIAGTIEFQLNDGTEL